MDSQVAATTPAGGVNINAMHLAGSLVVGAGIAAGIGYLITKNKKGALIGAAIGAAAGYAFHASVVKSWKTPAAGVTTPVTTTPTPGATDPVNTIAPTT